MVDSQLQWSTISQRTLYWRRKTAIQVLRSTYTSGTQNVRSHRKIKESLSFRSNIFSYLNRAAEGDTIVIDAKTIKAGKSLAYLECELRKKDNDAIIAKGTQTKFIGFWSKAKNWNSNEIDVYIYLFLCLCDRTNERIDLRRAMSNLFSWFIWKSFHSGWNTRKTRLCTSFKNMVFLRSTPIWKCR